MLGCSPIANRCASSARVHSRFVYRIKLNNVPARTAPWRGTGTVTVVPSSRFCIMRWLPRWRTARKPCTSRIWQISRPDRTRSLANRDLNLGHQHLAVIAPLHLGRICSFKKKSERFHQIRPGLFDRSALTGNVEFRAQRHKGVVFPLNDRCQALRPLHDFESTPLPCGVSCNFVTSSSVTSTSKLRVQRQGNPP